MKIKQIYFFFAILLFISCLTPKNEKKQVDNIIIEDIEIEKPQPLPTEEDIEPIKNDEYIATEEEYKETFVQVDDMISQLNTIISKADYNTWLGYLSDDYIKAYGDEEYLKVLSTNPFFKEYDIKLKNLKDYFTYVVVPSRSNVKVDEIKFITENQIIAYMYKDNNKFVVYQLEKDGNSWIITN